MKTNHRLILLATLLIFSFSVTGQTLSVKGRWNVKAGYSAYKLTDVRERLIVFDNTPSDLIYKRRWNVRVEANYGVLKWLETGVYIGIMGYEYTNIGVYGIENEPNAVAPTFGINANIHLLPFFVKNPKCKWDFYVPLKYGGNYIPKYHDLKNGTTVSHAMIGSWDDASIKYSEEELESNSYINWSKYRHEYGIGLGGAVYIKNIIGFYAEIMGGQFSYFPEFVKSPYNIRVGITAKF
ncbi:MAG: hypothetical protein LBS50_10895 [Prevotellaceae bacterium]|jgi:hypothetical protein|nr:hypothetical protein [Prevotellaceae bacterium]